MKVEFLLDKEIGDDGRQLFINESEFRKAKDDSDEFESFAFATHCLFSYYGVDDFINEDEYTTILSFLEKGGAVIISIVEEQYSRKIYPEVYVSNNNRLKKIDI